MNQPKQPRGIGAIRKDVTPQVAADVRKLATMFKHIAKHNPEAVRAAMGKWSRERADLGGTDMVQFYADNADYIAELFDYR